MFYTYAVGVNLPIFLLFRLDFHVIFTAKNDRFPVLEIITTCARYMRARVHVCLSCILYMYTHDIQGFVTIVPLFDRYFNTGWAEMSLIVEPKSIFCCRKCVVHE